MQSAFHLNYFLRSFKQYLGKGVTKCYLTHVWKKYLGQLRSPQQYIHHINPWKKCSNLMQSLKYLAEPFLRPLRSKDVRCWILRSRPRNFAIISESLAANLEKVRQTSVWQMVLKFWFICLFYCFSKTYSCK